MCSARSDAALPAPGFPIRVSTGQRPFSASPWLIAAVHALHRLLVPRHPPYALTILTVIDRRSSSRSRRSVIPDFLLRQLCGFQGPAEAQPPRWAPSIRGRRRGRSLKTQQCVCASRAMRASSGGPVDVPGPPVAFARRPARRGEPGGPAGRSGGAPVKELPRKEVIQPQLPLRLPCYDFTPITSPTFDGCLP